MTASFAQFRREGGGLIQLPSFQEVCDGVHKIVDVVPVVVDSDMLRLHVLLIGMHGRGERFFRAGVVAGAIEDVARHVDHVAGGWSEATQDFGAVQSLLRMRTGFDGMNPVMVRC